MSEKLLLLPILLLTIIYLNVSAQPTDKGAAPAANAEGPLTLDSRYRNDYMYRYQNSYYKFHRSPRTFAKAQKICQNEKSHLAIINSEDEARFLVEIMKQNPGTSDVNNEKYILIGFHNSWDRDEFFTIDGHTLDDSGYTTFDVGEPNYDGFCGSIKRDGTLNDLPCTVKNQFICEHEPNSGLSLGSRIQGAENEDN